eukprot:TRINITY_DN23518_c0_g1_i1.p1 TRINITY_DN23518_c0_g1~~TRINITY_DN23518_c0_g1_i1.p1  ORF type:complete len:533 (-),score=67.75 TRINITY_DN23518_c0_g1_i1:330-1928(-)
MPSMYAGPEAYKEGSELLKSSRHVCSWDFPLSRGEKLRRVLQLYEAEQAVATNILTCCDRRERALRKENESLRFRLKAPESCHRPRGSSSPHDNATVRDSCGANASSAVQAEVTSDDAGTALKASIRGAASIQKSILGRSNRHSMHPVQELQHSQSPVTCLCFGQETQHQSYILLAAAAQDGFVAVYKCYRTDMEIAMMSCEDSSPMQGRLPGEPVVVQAQLIGHTQPVTTAFFTRFEDQLVTASLDKSIRFWSVASGNMIKVFVAGSQVTAAALLPLCPQALVAATTGFLRVIDVHAGTNLHSSRLDGTIDVLEFDSSGCNGLAGTSSGCIQVLQTDPTGCLKRNFRTQLAQCPITCIHFENSQSPDSVLVLVGATDKYVRIAVAKYDPAGLLENLSVQNCLDVQNLQPCTHWCFSCPGFIISGSDCGNLDIHSLVSLGRDQPCDTATDETLAECRLSQHAAPVSAIAVNLQNTLLASADAHGCIVLWRRLDFSHLPPRSLKCGQPVVPDSHAQHIDERPRITHSLARAGA